MLTDVLLKHHHSSKRNQTLPKEERHYHSNSQKDMKKVFSLTAMAMLAANMLAQSPDTPFEISGTVPEGTKVVYYYINNNREEQDSVYAAQGRFSIKGNAESNSFITVVTDIKHSITIVNDRTPVTIDLEKFSVAGSPQNVQFGNFQKSQMESTMEMPKLIVLWSEEADEAKKKEYQDKFKAIEKKQDKEAKAFILEHKDSQTPAYVLYDYCYQYTYDELKELLDPTAAYYNNPMSSRARDLMSNLEKRHPGLQYTDFEMQDMDGKPVKLSKYMGNNRYVFVDFWASWCGPCRGEMPNVAKAYETYKDKGLLIVGVSLDTKENAWKQAVRELGMTWPQISDLKGWNSIVSKIYGVKSIPCNILIDPAGKIIGNDLRGDRLQETLKEIFVK